MTHTLEVPGAVLTHDVSSSGAGDAPVLLLTRVVSIAAGPPTARPLDARGAQPLVRRGIVDATAAVRGR
jgi:hypothetical protein